MEPADNNNQNPNGTPDLEKLANELTQASASTPSPEPTAPAPIPDLSIPVQEPAAPTAAPTPAPTPISPTPAPEPAPAPVAPAPTSIPVSSTPEPTPAPLASPSVTPSVDFTNPASTPSAAPEPTNSFGSPADSFSTPSDPNTPPSQPSAPAAPIDDSPLQPAAPVPGSIGSAQSYIDPATQAAQAAAEAKKPKFSRTTIIIIILAAVVLIGGIALAIILISSNSAPKQTSSNNSSSYTPVVEDVEPVLSGLVCVAPAPTAEYLEAIGSPSSYTDTITASFVDDVFSSWTQAIEATYDSTEGITIGLSGLQADYNTYTTETLGFTEDPFVTSYSITDNVVKFTHVVRDDNLSLPAATYMSIDVADAETVDDLEITYDGLEAIYTGKGYTCAIAEEVEEDQDN